MEIINRESKQIKFYELRMPEPIITMSSDQRRIRMNKSTVIKYSLKAGMYIHFMADIDRLYFFWNDDKAGFILTAEPSGGLNINSLSLCTMLIKKYVGKISTGNSFKLKKMSTKINDEEAIEVLLHTRRVSIIRKRQMNAA